MVSTVKVTNIDTPDNTGNITFDRPIAGDGSGLTSLSAANITSGGTLPTLNGSALTNLPSSGFTVGVRAYLGSYQLLANSTWTKINLAHETYDPNSDYDSATNYRFVAPEAGKYLAIGHIDWAVQTNGIVVYASIYKNGSAYASDTRILGGATSYTSYAHDIIDMNGTTDYLELWGRQNSGTNKNVYSGTTNTWLSIQRIA